MQRQKVLLDAEKHQATLATYFKSFTCLQPPLGVVLVKKIIMNIIMKYCKNINNKKYFNLQLQSDFKIQFFKKKILSKEYETSYSTLFSKTWPSVADKIIQYSKSKTRTPSVKEFFKNNESLVSSGILFNEFNDYII